MQKAQLFVADMVCSNCERKVENNLKRLSGVAKVKASFSSNSIDIVYDESMVELEDIVKIIEGLDYKVSTKPLKLWKSIIPLLIILLGGYYIIKSTIGFNFIPEISDGMSYGLIFIVGLLTSIHCIVMCGGIALSQGLNKGNGGNKSSRASLLYNLGRIISYTAIGGIVGGLGSILSPSGEFKGIVAILAGTFMLLFGLKMLNIFKIPAWLRFRIPLPNIPSKGKYGYFTPLFIGMFNGFMPCGPLQTMQLYALGTGSVIQGALSMFYFSIGTVPLMLGFGLITSVIRGNFGRNMIKASGVFVIILGIIMMNRGLSLSGYSLDGIMNNRIVVNTSEATINEAPIIDGKQIVNMTVGSSGYVLDKEVVKAGIPVKLNLNVEGVSRCNNPLLIPKYNIEVDLLSNNNVIEFTPTEAGSIKITCWMGMITTNLSSVEAIEKKNP